MTSGAYSVGLYQSGEGQLVSVSRKTPLNNTAKGVIAIHGHGADCTQMVQYQAAQGLHIKALADAGLIVMSIDAGGTATWGYSAAMTAISNAYTWLTTTGGAATGKVAIFAWSMGGFNALNWIKRNPTKCGPAALWAPASDLDFFHGTGGYTPSYSTTGTTAGNYTSEIDGVYGGSANYAANSAGYRVRDEYSSWHGIGVPIKIFHAVDDATVPVAQNRDAFVPGVNDSSVTFRSISSGGHTGLFDQVSPSEVINHYNSVSW
jgi:pimeloyl-ACP methyl ester carboxylesterase